MDKLSDICVFITVVSACITLFYNTRRVRIAPPRTTSVVLSVLFFIPVIAFYLAHNTFGVLPAWPFHLANAYFWTFAAASHIDRASVAKEKATQA